MKVRKPQERGANSSNVVAYRDLDSISKRDSFVVLGASSAVKKEAEKKKFFIDRKAEAKKQSVEYEYPEMSP